MLMAIEDDIRNSVFLFSTALLMPIAISMRNALVNNARFSLGALPTSPPVTALTGDTLAAFLAGRNEATNTVRKPTAMPAPIPGSHSDRNGSRRDVERLFSDQPNDL